MEEKNKYFCFFRESCRDSGNFPFFCAVRVRRGSQEKGDGMKTDLEKIRRQLRKMAFGKPNDCVKLAMCEDVDIEKLDLSMLTEIKRSEKGTVEIKLLDRTKVLEQLAALADGGNDGAERFLQALAQGMERGNDE